MGRPAVRPQHHAWFVGGPSSGRSLGMPHPHGRDLRNGRFSESGRIYHITTVTMNRERVFSDLYSARQLVRVLRETQDRGLATTLAYVVMPDHLHWLMQLGEKRTLSRVIGTVKSLMAHRLGGQIWQPSFHDHALRREEDLRVLARYIAANPVRAGLVENVADYSHWDAVWLE